MYALPTPREAMKITIKNLQKKIPINPKRIIKAALKTISLEGIKKPGEITLCFADDKTISEFNLQYLGRCYPTDVLAFNLSDNKKNISADILISTDKAVSNARIFKTTPVYELYLYLVHGILHILGYDDKNIRKQKIMRKRQEYICSQLNPA